MSQRVIQKVVLLILITPVFLVITGCEKSIHQAASSRDMERIKYLLEKDPKLLNKLDSFKRTPLHWATDMGNRNIAEFLINRGADVNIKDKFGKTPLDYAIDNDYRNLASTMILSGAKIPTKSDDSVKGKSEIIMRIKPLHQVTRNEELSKVEIFIKKYPEQIHVKDDYGRIPLYWAARTGNIEIVRLLVENGSDINLKDNDGWAALHTTAYNGREAAAEYLIKKGAELDIRNNDGETPLYWAARRGNTRLVKLLVKNGANINARTKSGKTPLSVAKNRSISEILQKKEKGN